MKVFFAGSRKFSRELLAVKAQCEQLGVETLKGRDENETDFEKMFQRIEEADVVYVVAVNGYIGKTVALEIGFAYAKEKEIIASEKINEEINVLISKTMDFAEFAKYAASKR